ncbi:hypothetical protein B0O99DRAFT_266947 [Bisporella sp. PMI_857]|nr:hypothetical protein B0O99DRAFT_266947 [Bisporella sp. PMI_857]
MRLLQSLSAAVSVLAPFANAIVTYTPSDTSNAPSFSVGIPSSSSISSSSTGSLYFSITAPGTYQWVGLGIGEQMRGATIFVIYTDGNGNVTISGRQGTGNVQPSQSQTIQSGLTLLEGSGVGSDGALTAYVKCTSCTLNGDKSATDSNWIAAWRQGSALDSTSASQSISQHNTHKQFTFDLSSASISSDSNPFISSATSPSSSASGTQSGSSPTGTGTTSGSTSGGTANNSGSQETVSSSQQTTEDYKKAHGIVMGVTVVLLFPIGALFMRVAGRPWVHAALQIFSLIGLIVGFGLGVKLGDLTGLLYKDRGRTHTIFGTVILALFLIQPVLGVLHHNYYKSHQSRGVISHIHIWFGRMVIALAIINGGLGLKLAANTDGGKIAYGVVAGVVALVYIVLVWRFKKSSGNNAGGFRVWADSGKRERVRAREQVVGAEVSR